MAFTSILRRSASSLAPLASRLARGQRSYHGAVATTVNHLNFSRKHTQPTPFVPTPRYYSSHSSDQSLIRVIESEIKCAEETEDLDKVEEIPSSFPFKIEDTPGIQTVTLKRTYQGEDIQVEVHMPDLVTGEDDNDDNQNDDNDEHANQSSIPLVVTVSKGNGPVLEFSITAYPDEFQIDSLAVKNPEDSEDQIAYEGPDFHDLDENLQKAFHKYLEVRGIKPSTTNFLHEYMLNKDSKEYANWLQQLKRFVEA
ncbi:uncharacterized protein At2g39795, mitochondrial [Pyrus x bretschneideri]|uniref:uncharacterized protein At2g39795, mitochondrial n=1 Tax=Pyrus x bretschneideri TaxID=225117 RepID=UPI00202E706D|nr:uncharacterized protein At2g39795, mitochondrial [Pyrus x bretschneideri]